MDAFHDRLCIILFNKVDAWVSNKSITTKVINRTYVLSTRFVQYVFLIFDYKVSSETNYDEFYFYVNGVAAFEQSGEIAWTHYTFTAAASRTYTFKWAYTKDSSVNRNDDAAYVDNVELVRINTGLLGDVNGDGVVDLIDASLLARYVLGLADQSALDLSVADVDGNGEIDLIDVVSVMRMVLDIA